MASGMNPKLLQPSSDSDKSAVLSCSALLPPSGPSSYSDESDPKRQKVEEDGKNGESDQHGDGDMKEENADEEDSSDEIEDDDDDDDEDDVMEVQQWTPIAHNLFKSIDEDDEGLQRYIKNITESEGFDLDENPLLEYQKFAYAIHKVDFDRAKHAIHVENIQRCLDYVIAEQKKQGNLVCQSV